MSERWCEAEKRVHHALRILDQLALQHVGDEERCVLLRAEPKARCGIESVSEREGEKKTPHQHLFDVLLRLPRPITRPIPSR